MLVDHEASARTLAVRRYGPSAVIVALLVLIAALVVTGDGDGGPGRTATDRAAGDIWTSTEGREPGAPDPTGRMPVTYTEAEADGTAGDSDWPATCDTDRGTVTLPSVYALPCVPAFDGDNGGDTAPGVTADTIRVVYYAPDVPADLSSILGGMGADDSAAERVDTLERYVELYSSVTEQYGRHIEVVRFAASGAPDDVVAARADATDVIALHPFAVIGGPVLDRGTFAQELAAAHIVCLGCGTSLPDAMVADMAPYVWDLPPSPEQTIELLGAWVGEVGTAATDTADLAGGDLRGDPRKVGVIHFEQDPPLYEDMQEERSDQLEGIARIESYVLDFPTLPAKAAELVAQFKSDGITTILFLGDPLMPIYLTEAATAQSYYPEWVFGGTALTDSNIFGRQYDQGQMAHAFGISQLAAPTEQRLQSAVTEYRWYFGGEDALPPARSQYGLIAPAAQWVVGGIHMAGPDLTPQTFARGMFRIPPAGGGPANPQVSFGNWGIFPGVDYQATDDAVQIWWDPEVTAVDERGVTGKGAWRRSDGGDRFTVDDPPSVDGFGDVERSITVVDDLSPEDTPPDYPPPPGSPADGR